MKRVIVVGSGIAALSFVRQLQDNIEVICITKDKLAENNSNFAQGGICFSKNENDEGISHSQDTFEAGAEMGDFPIIQEVITKSYPLIQELIDEGVPFDKDAKTHSLDYAMEGAHSAPRILHAGGDQTGKYIAHHMVHHLSHPHLTILEETEAVDFIYNEAHEVCGVMILDKTDQLETIEADSVVLATGGINNLFHTNSNIPHSIASGPVLALRNKIALESMEMIQFHPTLLGEPKHAFSLVSEAVRGDGAVLVNELDEPFMDKLHPMKSLAPRDVTSRAIYHQQQLGHQCFLDISAIDNFETRFPTIYKAVQAHYPGAMERQRIPVTPGAHYTVGGIQSDVNGTTSLSRVYAIGEAACTNFHGANRLASNSLLEGLVMGACCAQHLNQTLTSVSQSHLNAVHKIPAISAEDVERLQQQSFDVLGVERNGTQMQHYLDAIETTLNNAPLTEHISKTAWQHYCIVKLLQIVCTSALARKESRGVHYRLDYPNQVNQFKNEVIEIYSGGMEHVKSVTRQRENHSILH